MVKGKKIGDLLTLYQWECSKDGWRPIAGITVVVDGQKIKEDTWYKLDGSEFVEVPENEQP